MDSSEDSSGQSAPIPIAQINPAFDRLAESSIRAAVTLVWPYSSSTKSFSVLLAEPDVRLRRLNGQVKVTFHALVAERIAETHVGIGDEVVLGLSGCRLEGNGTQTQTPSRYVAWDVHFDNRVHIEISRASQHHATVKIDPPFEPESVQQLPEQSEPPVTPVPNRRLPEGIDTGPSLGAWTSPAFFQRSHASFGGLADSSVDPFAEEDGFIPGRGRKRPRFSMRSSEWRVVDEPASPGEKASPVDWTEELEAEVDEDEKAAENIEMPQESPEPSSLLQDTQETLDDTSFGYSATWTDQLAPETGPTIEEPVEPLTPTPAGYINGKEDFANSLQIPIGSPHLHPVPSPGLPVPSPLVSSTPENGYFASALAPTTQPSTTVTQSQEVLGDNGIQKAQSETVQVDTEDSNLEKAENITSFSHTAEMSVPLESELQTTTEITEQIPEDIHSEEEKQLEEEGVAASGGVLSQFPGRESPVKEIPHAMDVPDDHSDDVEMADEDEDEEEYSEDEMEQAADHDQVRSAERSPHGSSESADEEETAKPPLQTQEPAADYNEAEEISVEDEEEFQQDEHMDEAESEEYESEYGYEDREEDIVDSEMESDEDDEEAPEVPTRAPPSNIQPDVIVLDSDDEDEQPAGPQIQQPQSERESEDVEQHALSSEEDGGDWPSDEENEMGDESMAERQSYDEEADESGDGHSQDELVEEEVDVDEDEEEEKLEEEEEEEETAAEEQQRTGLYGEQPEQINLLDDEAGEDDKFKDKHAEDERIKEEEDEDDEKEEQYEANERVQERIDVPEDDQQVEDKEEEEEEEGEEEKEDLKAYGQAEARAEDDMVEYDTSKDEDHGKVPEGHIQKPEIPEHGQTGQDEDAAAIEVQQAESHGDRQEVELVDRTGRVEDKPDEDHLDEDKSDGDQPDESDAESQDEFVEPSEFLVAPEAPLAVEPALHQLDPEQQLELNGALIYDGAASPPGEWYDAPTDVDESASEQQDDEANGPSQQLAAEHEQQLHALVEAGGNTPAIEITGTPEPEQKRRPRSLSPKPNYAGLRSKYSYFAPLSTLPDHFNSPTDTISIIHDATPITQAQSGPRDYILTLHLTDPSMGGTTLLAQLTRPYAEALPQHPREGDAILLRNFKPRPFNRAMSLVSDDTSAWAVFPSDDAETSDVLVPGPPVEYGAEECSYASGLRRWYRDDGGAALVADVYLQASIDYDYDQDQDQEVSITSLSPTPSSNASISGSSDLDNIDVQNLGLGLTSGGLVAHRSLLRRAGRRRRDGDSQRRRGRRITIHELRDGRRYAEVGSPSDRESIHELRDGTVYANL